MKPLVSILIPAYNAGPLLAATVKSAQIGRAPSELQSPKVISYAVFC